MKAEHYLSADELARMGFASCGRHVFISRTALITHPERVHLGDMVRIDGHTTIVANRSVRIGSNVHIGSSVTISAAAEVTVGDFSGISAGVKLFTTDDDYSGAYLSGPTVPPSHTNITTAPVELHEHCVVGANSVILPGVVLEEGVVVGALSLVKGHLPAWGIYGGAPARLLKPRSNALLSRVKEIRAN